MPMSGPLLHDGEGPFARFGACGRGLHRGAASSEVGLLALPRDDVIVASSNSACGTNETW
jgi:hypothetical protein